jgi:hypothetical protein
MESSTNEIIVIDAKAESPERAPGVDTSAAATVVPIPVAQTTEKVQETKNEEPQRLNVKRATKSIKHVIQRGPRKGKEVWRRGEMKVDDVRRARAALVAKYMKDEPGLTFGTASKRIKEKGDVSWRTPAPKKPTTSEKLEAVMDTSTAAASSSSS